MKVAIGADHGGFALKEELKKALVTLGHDFVDYGTGSELSVDYPDFALPVAQAVASGECQRGILVCGTGIGVSIVANKVPGIRAALVHSIQTATLASEHNAANVLVLGGRLLASALAAEMVKAWLATPFDERHRRRVDKISAVEARFLLKEV
jgi:ribose 5-phosphate isomerase B